MRRALLFLCAVVALALPAAGGSHARVRHFTSYPWPVKPFDRQHAIRGNLDDPLREADRGSTCSCWWRHQGFADSTLASLFRDRSIFPE